MANRYQQMSNSISNKKNTNLDSKIPFIGKDLLLRKT